MEIEFNKNNKDFEQTDKYQNNYKSHDELDKFATLDDAILNKLSEIYKNAFHKAWLDSQKISPHDHIRIPDLIKNEKYNLQYSSYFELPKEQQDTYYKDTMWIANAFMQGEEFSNNEIKAIKNVIISFLTDHCNYYMYHEVWKCDGYMEKTVKKFLSDRLLKCPEYSRIFEKKIEDLAEKIHEKWMLSNSSWAKDRYQDFLVPFSMLSECNKASYMLGAILAYDITKEANEFREFLSNNYGSKIMISSDIIDQEFGDKIKNIEVNKEQIINEFLRCLNNDQLEAICNKTDVLKRIFNDADKNGINLIAELSKNEFIFNFTNNDDIIEIKKDYISNTIEEDLNRGYLFYKHNKDENNK